MKFIKLAKIDISNFNTFLISQDSRFQFKFVGKMVQVFLFVLLFVQYEGLLGDNSTGKKYIHLYICFYRNDNELDE